MVLKSAVLATIRNNKRIKNRLALEMDKSSFTIERWITTNDQSLTLASALKIIKEETGLTDNEILEESEVEKA